MRALALLLFVPLVVLADVGAQNAGVSVGQIRDLDAARDGGLSLIRDAGTAVGKLRCVEATAAEPGCVTPSAQTFAGTKTLTADIRLVGHVHGSLTACAAGTKGTWQTCTTHSAPVFCNGTTNIEYLGSSSAEELFYGLFVDGVPSLAIGAFNFSSTSGGTITALTGLWGAGTGAGSLPINLIHSGGTCACNIDCDVPGARTACSGNCSVSASALVTVSRGTSTCGLNPFVLGNLGVMGTKP
jgi:hypothetical protein